MRKIMVVVMCLLLTSCASGQPVEEVAGEVEEALVAEAVTSHDESKTDVIDDESLPEESSELATTKEADNETEAVTSEVISQETTSEEDVQETTSVEGNEEGSDAQEGEAASQEESSAAKEAKSTEEVDAVESVKFIEHIELNSMNDINEEKINLALEQGFESPMTVIDTYFYKPQSTDVIEYDAEKSGLALGESLRHKGFEGLEVAYDRTQYEWDDFFGDLDVSEVKRALTVRLKGDSIFETDIVDDYQKYYRYYDEAEGLYYEVSDFMTGNFLDEDAELTNVRMGNVCNYNSIEDILGPTYNPLVLDKDEVPLNYFVTVDQGAPCVYVETLFEGRLHKKWINIEFGVLVKELIFDQEGLLVEKKVATSITKTPIDHQVFEAPKDIEFIDITLFVYSLVGDLETLGYGIMNTIPASQTGILLTSETGSVVRIYTNGLDEMALDDPLYYSQVTLDNGEVRTIREMNNGRFYTVCDELEKVEIYDRSVNDKKFFDFENVGLIGVESTQEGKTYTFYDPDNISVSGLYDVYAYVIENNELTAIKTYQIEALAKKDPFGQETLYRVALIDFDESVYDDSFMETYTIIDRGENSFDDGEYRPFWYQEGE